MTDPIDWFALDCYLAGDASPEQRAAVERWIAADPAHQRLAEVLICAREDVRRPLVQADNTAEEWRKLAARLDVVPIRSGVAASSRRLWFARIAAVLVISLLGAFGYWATTRTTELATVQRPSREYATQRGQRARITLSDGTRILLGAESKLVAAADFGAHDRTVTLDGQAYFEVQHDARRPFVVRTRHAVARDLGTAFDVRAYRDDSAERVVVASGRVAVGGAILDRNDLAEVDSTGHARVARDVNVEQYLAWTAGELRFNRTPLATALRELSRWYGIDVRLADSSRAGEAITASFDRESADTVLATIARLLNMRVERSGQSAVLVAK